MRPGPDGVLKEARYPEFSVLPVGDRQDHGRIDVLLLTRGFKRNRETTAGRKGLAEIGKT